MPEVLLFHHVQGLTSGIGAFADLLRGDGHTVHTPDLFEGGTFESIDEGFSYVQGIGFAQLRERADRAVEDLSSEIVYGGFSLGVGQAQRLAQTRPGARGALLFHSVFPPSEFGSWPRGLPCQIHGMDHDPFFADEGDIDVARALSAEEEGVELFVYPGDQHLFSDSSLPSYDPDAAAQMTRRVLEFLAVIGDSRQNRT